MRYWHLFMSWMNWRSILKVLTSLIPIHKIYFNILKQSVKWVNYQLIIERLFSVPRCAKIIRLPDTEMLSCGPGNHGANCRTEDSTAFYKPGLISWLTVNLFICECYTTQEAAGCKTDPWHFTQKTMHFLCDPLIIVEHQDLCNIVPNYPLSSVGRGS